VTDDRQTDHATEKCVAIGGIACATAALQRNNLTAFITTNFINATFSKIHQTHDAALGLSEIVTLPSEFIYNAQ